MAAGFSLRPEQVGPFQCFLADAFAASADAFALASELEIDAVLSPAGATVQLVDEIAKAGPFGAGNAEPLIALPDILVRFADVVGKDHIRLRLAGGDGSTLDAIAFRTAEMPLGKGLLAARGKRVHLLGKLRADEWNGRRRIQLQVEDAASAEG
jgi:single-stranded-DNA-specific exonuclease